MKLRQIIPAIALMFSIDSFAEELKADPTGYALNSFLNNTVGTIPSNYWKAVTHGSIMLNGPAANTTNYGTTKYLLSLNFLPDVSMPSLVYRTQTGSIPTGTVYASIDDTNTTSNSQCVDLVKAMTQYIQTSRWGIGNKIPTTGDDFSVTLAWRGKAIASFNGNAKYSDNTVNPHVAIVLTVEYNTNGTLKGVWVADQNFYSAYPFGIAKHYLSASGTTGLNNPTTYNSINILP